MLRRRKFGEPLEANGSAPERRHLISVRLKNTIGALNRVCNLFSARGFNLESVAVGATAQADVARMTLATSGSDHLVDQVTCQLDGLIDTYEVVNLTEHEYVERELCLLKVKYTSENRSTIMDTLDIFRGKVVDVSPVHMTFEVTGPTKKINAFVGMMEPHDIQEIVRSGRVAMRRAMHYENGVGENNTQQ